MFCKNCGKDMGNNKFCTRCGTKADETEDNDVSINENVGTVSVNKVGYTSTAYTEQKSGVFEKFKKTEKIISAIGVLAGIIAIFAFSIAFTSALVEFDFSKATAGESTFKLALELVIQIAVPLGLWFGIFLLIPYVRKLITTLILRSTINKNNPSPYELLPYTLANGEYTIKTAKKDNGNAWLGLLFIERSWATKCAFARIIVSIVYAVIDLFLVMIYCINLVTRLNLAGGLPSENLFGFFVTPSLVFIILLAIVLGVVDTILYSKLKKGFEEIKTKYSK